MKGIGYKIAHLTLSLIITGDILKISLFYLFHQKSSLPKFFKWSTWVWHANISFTTKVKSVTECPFLIYKLFVMIKHLSLLSTVTLSLVEFIHILTAFYHVPISLGLLTHSLIDRRLRICSSCTKLHNKLVCLQEIIKKWLP